MASENDEILRNNYNNNEAESTDYQNQLSSTTSQDGQEHQQNDCSTTTANGTARQSSTDRRTTGPGGSSDSPSLFGDYKNIRATVSSTVDRNESQTADHPIRREENPFSFKHFLSREATSCNTPSSSSFTYSATNSNLSQMSSIISVSSTLALNSDLIDSHNSSDNNCNSNAEISSPGAGATSQPATSGRTVPSTVSCSSLSSVSSYQTSTGARPKVPQSSSVSTTSMSSLAGGPESSCSKMKRSPRFSSFDSQASLHEYTSASGAGVSSGVVASSSVGLGSSFRGGDPDRLDDQIVTSTDRSDLFAGSSYDKGGVHRSYSNYDMDLPGRSRERNSPLRKVSPPGPIRLSGVFPRELNLNKNSSSRPPNSEFAAAALPDFVQDHWMDPWYYNEMNLSSPPNSPNSPVNFVEDLPAGMANPIGQSDKCQTLPDFLSDGPIIHSSGRLADVAAGLPDLDSPEDDSPSLQLSRLQLENDRLRRELDETRLTLAEQTRRAGELECVLEQRRREESAYNRTLAQNIGLVEENLDQSKKRTAAAQNQVSKLKQQVKQLTAEVESLRRENDSLREEGAVGGNTDRIPRRSSRTQHLSRELLRAASNAESNLRQLLTGVENLRLMAASIESMDENFCHPSAQHSTDDFLSDCDDYDEFTGGPAL